ncbi:MAG TPA: carbohydrate kinase family protein [bacterium]|nr:carbohydrate kinase family protein [bacterium]
MPARVVVIGSVYWDLIFYGLNERPRPGIEVRTSHFAMTPGGGAYITAVGLVRLGHRPAVWTYVGRDRLGQLLLDGMRRERLDLAGVQRHSTLGTAISVAFSTNADRGFLTYKGCAAATGALVRARSRAAVPRVRHVHFAGARPPFDPYLRLLERLRAAHITTSLDIGWNPEAYAVPEFRQIVKQMTIFMPSQRDARWFTGRTDPREAVRALGELVPMPVIKLGAEGSVGLEHGRPVRMRPPRVKVVETTGAGDAFNAGFLWAWLRDEPLAQCLWAGNICGAFSTRAPGGAAAFPTLRELRAALREAAR